MLDEKSLERIVKQRIAGDVLANISQEDINSLLTSQIEAVISKMDYWSMRESLSPIIREKLEKVLEEKPIQELIEKRVREFIDVTLPIMVESMIKAMVGSFTDRYNNGKSDVSDVFVKLVKKKFGDLKEVESL